MRKCVAVETSKSFLSFFSDLHQFKGGKTNALTWVNRLNENRTHKHTGIGMHSTTLVSQTKFAKSKYFAYRVVCGVVYIAEFELRAPMLMIRVITAVPMVTRSNVSKDCLQSVKEKYHNKRMHKYIMYQIESHTYICNSDMRKKDTRQLTIIEQRPNEITATTVTNAHIMVCLSPIKKSVNFINYIFSFMKYIG